MKNNDAHMRILAALLIGCHWISILNPIIHSRDDNDTNQIKGYKMEKREKQIVDENEDGDEENESEVDGDEVANEDEKNINIEEENGNDDDSIAIWKKLEVTGPSNIIEFIQVLNNHARETVVVAY